MWWFTTLCTSSCRRSLFWPPWIPGTVCTDIHARKTSLNRHKNKNKEIFKKFINEHRWLTEQARGCHCDEIKKGEAGVICQLMVRGGAFSKDSCRASQRYRPSTCSATHNYNGGRRHTCVLARPGERLLPPNNLAQWQQAELAA